MNRKGFVQELKEIVGDRYVLTEKEDVIVYEQDGSILQVMPEIVVLPARVEQVSAVVRAARRENLPIVPRGSGTGLAGGAVPAGWMAPSPRRQPAGHCPARRRASRR